MGFGIFNTNKQRKGASNNGATTEINKEDIQNQLSQKQHISGSDNKEYLNLVEDKQTSVDVEHMQSYDSDVLDNSYNTNENNQGYEHQVDYKEVADNFINGVQTIPTNAGEDVMYSDGVQDYITVPEDNSIENTSMTYTSHTGLYNPEDVNNELLINKSEVIPRKTINQDVNDYNSTVGYTPGVINSSDIKLQIDTLDSYIKGIDVDRLSTSLQKDFLENPEVRSLKLLETDLTQQNKNLEDKIQYAYNQLLERNKVLVDKKNKLHQLEVRLRGGN